MNPEVPQPTVPGYPVKPTYPPPVEGPPANPTKPWAPPEPPPPGVPGTPKPGGGAVGELCWEPLAPGVSAGLKALGWIAIAAQIYDSLRSAANAYDYCTATVGILAGQAQNLVYDFRSLRDGLKAAEQSLAGIGSTCPLSAACRQKLDGAKQRLAAAVAQVDIWLAHAATQLQAIKNGECDPRYQMYLLSPGYVNYPIDRIFLKDTSGAGRPDVRLQDVETAIRDLTNQRDSALRTLAGWQDWIAEFNKDCGCLPTCRVVGYKPGPGAPVAVVGAPALGCDALAGEWDEIDDGVHGLQYWRYVKPDGSAYYYDRTTGSLAFVRKPGTFRKPNCPVKTTVTATSPIPGGPGISVITTATQARIANAQIQGVTGAAAYASAAQAYIANAQIQGGTPAPGPQQCPPGTVAMMIGSGPTRKLVCQPVSINTFGG